MATFTRSRAGTAKTHEDRMNALDANIGANIELIFSGDGGIAAPEQVARMELLEKVSEAIAIGGLSALQQLIGGNRQSRTEGGDKSPDDATSTRRGRERTPAPGTTPAPAGRTRRTRPTRRRG